MIYLLTDDMLTDDLLTDDLRTNDLLTEIFQNSIDMVIKNEESRHTPVVV